MPKKRILIVYGSRYGSTGEISQRIAEILESKELTTDLVNLKNTKEEDWPKLEPFDGILVGSGIRASRWVEEPRKFLNKNKEELKKREKTLGIFVSCGFATVPPRRPEAKQEYIEKNMAELGIEPHITDAFGALLDFSPTSKLGFLDKQILKIVAKGMAKETSAKIEANTRNDLRDWNQIQHFTEQFAKLAKAKTPQKKKKTAPARTRPLSPTS